MSTEVYVAGPRFKPHKINAVQRRQITVHIWYSLFIGLCWDSQQFSGHVGMKNNMDGRFIRNNLVNEVQYKKKKIQIYFFYKNGLTLKAPITTAADDKFFIIFHNFRKQLGKIYHTLFVIFEKAAKCEIVVCHKL